MRAFYWRRTTNFGDAINSWLWDALFPGLMNADDGVQLVGIGSLVKADLNRVPGLKVIFGSGAGYGLLPDLAEPSSWKVYFVRGPLTARAAKLPQESGVVDAAWLIGLLDEFKPIPPKRGVCFIPHFSNAQFSSWNVVCDHAGLQYIDPLADSRQVISQIARCELAITESLHGAIIADYFRTPWIPVSLSSVFLDFKWLDWCRSVEVSARVHVLPPTDLLDHIRQGIIPFTRRELVYKDLVETNLAIDPGAVKKTASRWYLTKQRWRRKAHHLKHRTVSWLSRRRNPWGVHTINRRLTESLAIRLQHLTREKHYLSSDRIREEKMQQLAERVSTLKRDYLSGKIAGQRLPR